MKNISFFILLFLTTTLAILFLPSCVSQVYPNMLGKWEVFIYQVAPVGIFLDFYITNQSGGVFSGEGVVPDGVFGTIFGLVQPNGEVAIAISVTVEHSTDQSMSFQGKMISVNDMSGDYTMFKNNQVLYTGFWTAHR
ncbi:MAG TPA: hypothetical protein PKZ64_17180 [Spirochaetota bacterium]|nr:hypothetical protein [Spirochaetota bacterium]